MAEQIPRNPFIESIYAADPSARSWDGEKIYLYASHDIDPPRGCDLMDRYHVFSSADMVNWVDEGEILCSGDVKWGRPEGGFMWAPDCAYRDGLYYFYYPHPSGSSWNDTWKIGVATSRYPNKGFTDRGYIKGLGGFALIDPCVFTDDDGQAYIYIGGGSRAQGAKLCADMMTVWEGPFEMEGLLDYHEATWVFKRNGVYYLTYSDNTQPYNLMRYAVSNSPLGPWTHRGAYMEPVGCETSHGSVAEFKGQWYQFYHCQDISGQGTLRSVCVDKLFFGDDGSILPMKQTRGGIRSFSIPDNAVTYPASSLERMDCGGFILRNADGGKGGRATIWVRYATDERLAKLRLTVNGKDLSYINFLAPDGAARLTVTLKPGAENEIILSGGIGAVDIRDVAVSYFEDDN
ncbi:MAG: family 43 glycosylhydrolase [Defluviitaleaceae bacterium]|nr:family 43 glycosylhydrolase [Defluviitaleaceae bacterium]MCL2837298.1 family 43 glycosylhydrolase [Defluviitaleaceae bacterium]